MFKPEFCPNPDCQYHDPTQNHQFVCKEHGNYITKTFGQVPRYRCTHCHKTFSQQTFSIDYYCKMKVDYRKIWHHVRTASGVRDAARDLGVRTESIRNRTIRLSRQCIAAHAQIRKQWVLKEDLSADGIQNFCYSQYHPNNTHILVTKESQYVAYFDYIPLRRSGRKKDSQSMMRDYLEQFYKPDPRAILKGFKALLKELDKLCQQSGKDSVILYTDMKRQYATALKELRAKMRTSVSHDQTHSKKYRNYQNKLFACNYLDREIRKDCAEYARETVQFGRRTNAAMHRLNLFLTYHNYFKVYRIRKEKTDPRSHGEVAGIPKELINRTFFGCFTKRAFRGHQTLNPFEETLWKNEVEDPAEIIRNKQRKLRVKSA